MAKGGAGQVVGIAGVALVGYWILRVALPKIQTQQAQAGAKAQPASGGGNGIGYSPMSGVLEAQLANLQRMVDAGNAINQPGGADTAYLKQDPVNTNPATDSEVLLGNWG